MVRAILMICLCWAFGVHGQSQTGYAYSPRKVTYRTSGTFSSSVTYTPGIMLDSDQTNFYLHGFGEYHFNRRVSAKGDAYWFLNSPDVSTSDQRLLRSNFGVFYHMNSMPIGKWDVKLGVSPGILFYQRSESLGSGDPASRTVAPSMNVSLGYDYYVWDYFHFFAQMAYGHATVRGLTSGSQKMNELLFSVGLGFQIQTRQWFRNRGE